MPAMKALYDKILSDTSLTSQLATYGTSPETPAVFVGRAIPRDSSLPAISLTQRSSDRMSVDRHSRGGGVSIDVSLWGDNINSNKDLRKLSMDLWKLLDRSQLVSDGTFEFPLTISLLPNSTFDPDGFPGYLLNVTVLIREL